MRLLFFLVLTMTLSAQVEPVLWKVEKDTILEWRYFFGDEFNGTEVNETLWHPKYPWGGLLADEGSYADEKMVSQDKGLLKLSADTTSEWKAFPKWILETGGAANGEVELRNGNEVHLRYLCSALWSKQKFKYGYFEARCKSPRGRGLWPAFWLYGGFPNEEIDFMEMKGEKHKHFHVDVHCPDKCSRVKTGWFGRTKNWGAWIKTDKEITENFVVYSGVWKPGEIKMYLNGQEVATYKGDFETSMSLIANLAIAQDNKAFGPGIDEHTKLPSDFYVDYMRVWHPIDGYNEQKDTESTTTQDRHDTPIENSKIIQSDTKAKKTKRFMMDRGTRHLGFISMTQDDANQLLFEKNGFFENSPSITIADGNKNELSQIEIDESQVYFSLINLKKGTYYIKLNYNNSSNWVELKI
ncbi:MAG: glycoside hydrolase family 16 protein [Crocinitomicaceae bacterium]|tara:strand:+ start:9140 stop:10372 length:1233 start_codon:yes stop_codon:yes gene_type:complete